MADIDLESPGVLTAQANNAKDYTFYLMLPSDSYTKEALAQDPGAIAADDLLFKSDAVADADGRAAVELAPKADEIKDKLQQAGKPSRTDAMLAVVTTSKEDNPDPAKKEADIQSVTLVRKGEEITLTDIKATARAQDWVAYHHPICFFEMKVEGEIREVEITYGHMGNQPPMLATWEQAEPGTAKCKRLVLGSVGDPHAPTSTCPNPQSFHRRSWWGGVPGWGNGRVRMQVQEGVPYVLGIYPRHSGSTTLAVKGTGAFAHVTAETRVTMEPGHPHPGD